MATDRVQPDGGGDCYLKGDGRAARSETVYVLPWRQFRHADSSYHIV
jgi:hypothetical protein